MEDEYSALMRQFGLFFRRAERWHRSLHLHGGDRPLERAAYQVLNRIAGGGPSRLSALADDLCVDLSTISRQVAALQAAGLVGRMPDPRDGRASLIAATPAGQALFTHNREKWTRSMRDLLADWTPAERQEFVRLFTRLNEAIAAYADTAVHNTANGGQETR